MYRNQYDTDVTTFSPAGRIHQVEYAMEAVKQGSACVGVKSRDFVVLAASKRMLSDMSAYQPKIFPVDQHMGIATSGLISDARVLRKYMINECLNHKFSYGTPMPTGRLVVQLADKSQYYTQQADKRPYGVGLLVAGYDSTGAHLYMTDPSGNYFEYIAHAMGARSQSAKTYLEKEFQNFEEAKLDDLIKHALTALKSTTHKGRLTIRNTSIAFVGKDTNLVILDDEKVRQYVEQVSDAADAADDEKDDSMDVGEIS